MVTVDGYCWWSNKTIEMRLELGSQWIPSTLGLMFLQRFFWARIIKLKRVLEVLAFHDFQAWKKLQFTNCSMKKMRMFFSFVDSQQIVPISLKSFQNWCQHIICLNKLKRVWRHVHFFWGYIDFRFLNARKSYGEHHEVSWQGMVFPRDHGWVGMTKTGIFFNQKTKELRFLTHQYSHSCNLLGQNL